MDKYKSVATSSGARSLRDMFLANYEESCASNGGNVPSLKDIDTMLQMYPFAGEDALFDVLLQGLQSL